MTLKYLYKKIIFSFQLAPKGDTCGRHPPEVPISTSLFIPSSSPFFNIFWNLIQFLGIFFLRLLLLVLNFNKLVREDKRNGFDGSQKG